MLITRYQTTSCWKPFPRCRGIRGNYHWPEGHCCQPPPQFDAGTQGVPALVRWTCLPVRNPWPKRAELKESEGGFSVSNLFVEKKIFDFLIKFLLKEENLRESKSRLISTRKDSRCASIIVAERCHWVDIIHPTCRLSKFDPPSRLSLDSDPSRIGLSMKVSPAITLAVN